MLFFYTVTAMRPEQRLIFYVCAIFIICGVVADNVTVLRQNNSSRCTLPQHPVNGQWSISGLKSILPPGREVSSGTIINVRCNGQYTLDGPSLIECTNGVWKSKIGKCLELCPPLTTTFSTTSTCTINGKTTDNCMKPTNGTVATFTCAPFYENAELNRNPFRICLNGRWSEEISVCTPVCGVKPKANNQKRKAHYPWNAALYKKQGKELNYACTGTLINEKTILTAAHCVTDQLATLHTVSDYMVAVGKTFVKQNEPRDEDAQFSELEDMFVPKAFKGVTRKYFGDIAVLIAKTPFKMTRRVQPACVDWTNKYAEEFENPNELSIAGPIVREYYPFHENITEIPVPLVNDTACYRQLDSSIVGNVEALYAGSEKYCSGYINSDKVPRCLVDHGVGLVTKNQYDLKYYVVGVLSNFPSMHGENCDNKRWTLYTKVSQYVTSFITAKVNLYTPINRSYFQTSCGIKSVKAQILIVNGKNVTKGDYPWQVALYTFQDSARTLICGGSLINQRVILTAAHCVTDLDGNTLSKELFAAAVGKYYRSYDDSKDTQAQFSSLKSIFVPGQYKGELQNYVADIAILVTENSFTLTKQVQPICMDWDGKYEQQFLKPSVNGYVAGWGFTQQNQRPSEELKDLEVPYIEPSQCRSKLPEDYEVYLTYDKLCSGFLNEGKSVCNGDSGGGLVFKNKNDDRYYLAGIVSLSPQAPTGGCDSQQYALYTRVSPYVKEFILEKVRLYWA